MAKSAPLRWSRRASVAAVAAGLVVVIVAGLTGEAIGATWDRPGFADWGDLPGWLEALSTFAAAIGAGVAVYYAHRAYRLELDRDTARDKERRQDEQDRLAREYRAQAELIAVWATPVKDNQVTVPGFAMSNASTLPVYDVEVVLARAGAMDQPVRLSGAEVDVLPPGKAEHRIPTEALQALYSENLQGQNMFINRAAIRFRDIRGTRWQRDALGNLDIRDEHPPELSRCTRHPSVARAQRVASPLATLPQPYTEMESELATSAGSGLERYRQYHPDGFVDEEFPDGTLIVQLNPLDQVDDYGPPTDPPIHFVHVVYPPGPPPGSREGTTDRIMILALTELGRTRLREAQQR